MVSIFYTTFDSRLSNGEFQSLLSILPQKDQRRIQRFNRWQDRQIHLAGRLLLLNGLLENGFPVGILDSVKTNAYGKPFINNNIEFSLSNSGLCSICAITDSGPVGIDIETMKDIDISDFKSLMSLDEWEEIQNSRNRLNAFYNFWTKKEAILKADGRGFSLAIDQIHIENKSVTISGKKWHIAKIPIESPYICHLATSRIVTDIALKRIEPRDLCFSSFQWDHPKFRTLEPLNFLSS